MRVWRSGVGDARNDGGTRAESARIFPLDISPEIERKIERVLILADHRSLKRPIAAATVLDALPRACERDAALCEDVRRYLASLTRTAGISYASLTAGGGSGADTPLPNRHGMSSQSNYEAAIAAYWQPGDFFLMTGGVLAYEGEATPTGTVASIGRDFAQIDIGYRDHWWSPAHDNAMLLSTQAATMPSVTISNYRPFTTREAALRSVHRAHERVLEHRVRAPARPRQPAARRLASVDRALPRLVARRRPDHAVRRRRTRRLVRRPPRCVLQSGRPRQHRERPRTSAIRSRRSRRSSWSANRCRSPSTSSTPARTPRRSATSGSATPPFPPASPSRSSARGSRATFEISEWQNGWYVHHIYRDGLRHEGHVLGHWGGDWRVLDDGVGARSAVRARWTSEPALRRRDRSFVPPARQRGLQRRQLRDRAADRRALQPAVGAVVRRRRDHARPRRVRRIVLARRRVHPLLARATQ